MTADALMFAAWVILAIVFLWAALAWTVRQKKAIDSEAHEDTIERSIEHEAMAELLKLWLSDKRIQRVILEQRCASEQGLLLTLASVDAFTFEGLKDVGSALMRNREVRRAVALFEERRGGVTKAAAMAPLLEWAQYERPRVQEPS